MTKLAVAQTRCVPGNIAHNLAHGAELIAEAARQGAQVVCLPESFGKSGDGQSDQEGPEPVPGRTSQMLCQAAAEGGLWVVAGIAERAGDQRFNSALVISPQGEIVANYHKCYLYLGEADSITPGRKSCLVDMGFARAAITICYDYMFPEYIRSLVVKGAQLIIHSTAWWDTEECRRWGYPATEAYRAQNRVRALENGVWLMSANRAVPVGGTIPHGTVGHSCIVSPWGEMVAELGEEPGVAVAEVDFEAGPKWAEAVAPYLRDALRVPLPE